MHGDFSRWYFDFRTNDHGLLHQQGKVLLDQDVNAIGVLAIRWQIEAARAAFGTHVVAVPEDNPGAFRVTAVTTYDRGTLIHLERGRVFCDGALAYLNESGTVAWRAEPAAPAPPAGTREAIVLECWHTGLSGFQDPRLLEPALGGPDTAVRAHLAMALRLVPLGEDQGCDDATIDHDTGRLTVTLDAPDTLGDPDCPIEDAGGYRGINHHQYRVEIAVSDDGVERFKWSRYNGGLVGRGTFTEVGGIPRLTLSANHRAIATSGLTSVYVEVVAYDDDARGWYVVYGARGNLANDHEIDLAPTPIFGGVPGDPEVEHFVRIWDGIEPIGTGPQAIGDGINVTFTGGGPYPPDAYWGFAVRAGLPNPTTLLDDERSHGPGYLRAPLATFTWGPDGTVDPATIVDCRRPIPPLTRRDGCCTIRVGDGTTSLGDVTSIQEAIERLPEDGGTICVLPGVHLGPAKLVSRRNVTIQGCGWFSVITGTPAGDAADPAIHVSGGSNIRIENLTVAAHDLGNGILVTRDPDDVVCKGLVIERVFASGAGPSAIDIDDAVEVVVRDCDIVMADRVVQLPSGRWPALTLLGADCRVEKNRIRVAVAPTAPQLPPLSHIPPGNTLSQPGGLAVRFAQAGLGGLWLRGGCSHVTVLDNRIESGTGHGIILGHIVPGQTSPGAGPRFGWIHNFGDLCEPCAPGTIVIIPGFPGNNVPAVAGPPLYRILIEGNEIQFMGQSGIGVYGFFTDANDNPDPIAVLWLRIVRNYILMCVSRARAPLPAAAITLAGHGAIALAAVFDLDVDDNRIEFNGALHDDPVCALYVHTGHRLRITDNIIEGNGVHAATATAAQGARGGIYVERHEDGVEIHGNRIDAPIGHAIRTVGEDNVVVTDNRLRSRSANNVNQLVFIDSDGRSLAFNDNDTEFDGREVLDGNHPIQLDADGAISFADNFCRLQADEGGHISHVLLKGSTVRMTSCRLLETFQDCVQFSAIVPGTSTLATVTLNQTDHCLAVEATTKIQIHNFEHGEIDPSDCKDAATTYFSDFI